MNVVVGNPLPLATAEMLKCCNAAMLLLLLLLITAACPPQFSRSQRCDLNRRVAVSRERASAATGRQPSRADSRLCGQHRCLFSGRADLSARIDPIGSFAIFVKYGNVTFMLVGC